MASRQNHGFVWQNLILDRTGCVESDVLKFDMFHNGIPVQAKAHSPGRIELGNFSNWLHVDYDCFVFAVAEWQKCSLSGNKRIVGHHSVVVDSEKFCSLFSEDIYDFWFKNIYPLPSRSHVDYKPLLFELQKMSEGNVVKAHCKKSRRNNRLQASLKISSLYDVGQVYNDDGFLNKIKTIDAL